MNKILLLIIAAIVVTHAGYTQDPVAYLPLDDNLNDYSGNALHATDAGTESTAFVDDSERGLVAFFPLAAHAQLPVDPKLSFGTGDFSVAFWIKVDEAPGSDPAILSNKDWGSGGNPGFLIALDGADDPANSHMWTSNIADGSGRLDWDADDNNTPNLADGTWHFVLVAYDRDATMNVYIDGELKQTDPAQDSKDMTLVPGDISADNLPITIMQDGTGAYGSDFEAYIDEVYVYDRVVEADEVMKLKEFGLNPVQDVVQGADVYLPFDGDLNDASGNGLHATDAGAVPTEFVEDPERGMVGYFPVEAHAQLPLDPQLAMGTGDFSVAFWIKVDEAPGSDPAVLSNKDWGSGGNPGFLIALDGADDPANEHMWTSNVADGSARLDWDADDNGAPNLVDGTWHYVAVAYDRDATMNVYFDGELKQTDPDPTSKDMTLVPGDLSAHGLPITIMQDGTGAYGADFAGFIDEVRVWNGKVLSAGEVVQSMNAEAGVDKRYAADVYLPLDADFTDASGNGLDATDAGAEATVFEIDPERGPVAFFPTAAHAQLPLDPALNFGTEDFSVAFWIRVDDTTPPTSDPSILSNKDWGGGGNPGFLIALDGANDPANEHRWTSNVADGSARLDWDADDNNTPTLVDDAWHFVAVTYDRDATMNVYFDGELRQSDPEQDSKDMTLVPGDITAAGLPITVMQDGTGNYGADFEAWIDEVRVWSGKVISPLEILNMYKYKEAAPASDLTYGADVYLPLDEDLRDQSGNGVDATSEGAAGILFVEDLERGMVAEFPVAAHAQFPDNSLLNFGTGDFTVSFWVKINANTPVAGDPVILGNKDWNSGGNPGFQIGLDGADDPAAHLWTVNVADGTGRLDWDADDNETPNLKDGSWHFVTVAFDRDATMNVYYDGILRQSDPAQDSKDMTLLPGDLNAAGLPLTIMQDGTGMYSDDFEARLDDIRIWKDRVLTSSEVAEIYNPEDNPYEAVAFLPLNSNLFDYSGNNIHAEDEGTEAARFVKDPDRGDVALFPVAAHAQFPLDPTLDFGTEDFSVGFWIRINPSIDTPGDPVIIGNKDWNSGGNPGFQIGLDGADDPAAHLWTVNVADGTGRLDWDADDNETPNLKDGSWHLVIAAFDRDATLNVYFDGVLRQSDPAQDSKDLTLVPGSLSSAGLPLTIMQDGTGSYGDDFSALLDNVRVWDRVVTDSEVEDIFAEDVGSGIGDGETEIVLSTPEMLEEKAEYFATYPNPVNNHISNVTYFLKKAAHVRITVYDNWGRLVKVVQNGHSEQGHNSIQWDTGSLVSGLYIYRIEGMDQVRTLRVVLNK